MFSSHDSGKHRHTSSGKRLVVFVERRLVLLAENVNGHPLPLRNVALGEVAELVVVVVDNTGVDVQYVVRHCLDLAHLEHLEQFRLALLVATKPNVDVLG